ncbi:MAG: T9SS type A sorting domain-containing protein [Flavobacteriales bacterium]|nr:T9SS type A sorting domain-containing protein [Flavobacteriales bacterium]
MKKLLLSFAIASMVNWQFAQEFDWVRTISGTNADLTVGVKTDTDGNVISAGQFKNVVDFDPGTTVVNLDAGASSNVGVYISKYNSSGDLIWAKDIIGENITITGFDIDSQNNTYVIGAFQTTIDFGAASNNLTFTSQGSTELYIAKFNSAGVFQWAKTVGNVGGIGARSITVDNDDNLIFYGSFTSVTDFDPGTSVSNLVTGDFQTSSFMAKWNSSGNFVWVKQYAGSVDIVKVAIDNENNFIATGSFNNSAADMGGITLTSSSTDIFIAKYASAGNLIWAYNVGGTGMEGATDISIDPNDNIVIAGLFNGTADFDPSSATFPLTVTGPSNVMDIFVAKYSASGSLIWAQKYGVQQGDAAYAVATDLIGNIYVTGYFGATVDFDQDPINTFNLTSEGSKDEFILKLRPSGNFAWAGLIEGSFETISNSIHIDNQSNIYIGGKFKSSVDFDPNASINNSTSAGDYDGFALKLKQCAIITEDVKNSCGSYTWIDGITYTSNNNSAIVYFQTAQGCDSVIRLNLTINSEVLEATTILSNYTIFANVPNASYQWINCANNEAIEGETAQVFVASVNGEYAVIVSRNGCSDTSTCVTINTLGLNENLEFGISVFPNPATSDVSIENSNGNIESVIVYNTTGQMMAEYQVQNTKFNMTLNYLSKGIYIFHVKTENGTIIKRFIKN